MTDRPLVRLVRTCTACPEQYDAYIGDDLVGYLRLRHGSFTVRCPDSNGELVYEAAPDGDGCFDVEERDRYLRFAVAAILSYVETRVPDVEYVIDE